MGKWSTLHSVEAGCAEDQKWALELELKQMSTSAI